jgi:NAD(P)-dependent dehydrogenase (short-subunit alcohol dehydrogenase family)
VRGEADGRVAFVTGAGSPSGIGFATARILGREGAALAIGSTTERIHDRAAELEDAGVEVDGYVADLTDREQVARTVDAIAERFGRIDILVNNAGLGTNHDALDATEEEWDELLDVNLKGLFFACQAAGRHMVDRGYGRIVNMSSQAGHVGIRRHAGYCASKGGVELLTKVLALEWGGHGVTVNAVAPTFVRTPGTAQRLDRPEFLADVVSRIPVGRVGTTAEVAAAVIFLASKEAAMVNGTSILVDGGWTAQ